MHILVVMKLVPDPVEELDLDPDTKLLDRAFTRLVPNELDEHALEQALLIKERHGAEVTVLSFDEGDVDELLFTALARGADRAIKVVGPDFAEIVASEQRCRAVLNVVPGETFDWILTGTQATDDLDGSIGQTLAAALGWPFLGCVVRFDRDGEHWWAHKEFPGGRIGRYELEMPAVLGIQAAEKPPRYVVTNFVVEAMKTRELDDREAGDIPEHATLRPSSMFKPDPSERAEWIEGAADQVAERLVSLFEERGLVGHA